MAARILPTDAALRLAPVAKGEPATLTLAGYLATVATAISAGLPRRSWVEATVVAVKPGPHGHSLQLVDPAGGASPAQLRAFLRGVDGEAIAARLAAPFDPALLVGITVVALIEPQFDARWGLGARIVGLSETVRDGLLRRAVEEIRQRLQREGLYGRQRRLPTPPDVLRVAVIHPSGAAGWADIEAELARWSRAGIIAVTSVPAAFEGPRAAAELVAALTRTVSGADGRPDVVLTVRGGGARAGLLALDDEKVVRAVCLCPVPIVTGLGHASDLSLLDEVAWASADTPSKALARLAALIAEPARRARADMVAIETEAGRAVAAAGHALDLIQHRTLAQAERQLAGAASHLAETWSGIRTRAAGANERCARLDHEAAGLLAAVLDRAPQLIDEAGRAAERLLSEALDRVRRRVERADDGSALMAGVAGRARALLDAAAAEVERRIEGPLLGAARRLTDAETDLGRLMALVESLGLEETLARGFVVVLDRQGGLVSTRAAALSAGDVTLQFVDGAVAARVELSSAATIIGEAA